MLYLFRFLVLATLLNTGLAQAAVTLSHGFARFGQPAYPASFSHFDWVNPAAPKAAVCA